MRTGTETVHLWEWGRAATDHVEGGEGAFAEFAEARSTASHAAEAGPASRGLFGSEGVDYFVGCHYDASSQQLMLLAGHEGTMGFLPVAEQPEGGLPGRRLVGAELQPPVMCLQGMHTGVVRSVQCFDQAHAPAFCITGAEDAQICLWSLNPETPDVAVGAAATGKSRGHRRRPRGSKGHVGSPGPSSGPGENAEDEGGVGPVLEHGTKKQSARRLSPY